VDDLEDGVCAGHSERSPYLPARTSNLIAPRAGDGGDRRRRSITPGAKVDVTRPAAPSAQIEMKKTLADGRLERG
jgi:hypothetical protein